MAPVARFIIGPPQGSQPSNRELSSAARGRQDLAAEPDHAAARYPVFDTRAAEARVRHLHHAAATLAEAFGDDTDELLGDVDHDHLHRLAEHAVDGAGHDLGVAELHLEPLAAHRFDEDRELELAAAPGGEGG